MFYSCIVFSNIEEIREYRKINIFFMISDKECLYIIIYPVSGQLSKRPKLRGTKVASSS